MTKLRINQHFNIIEFIHYMMLTVVTIVVLCKVKWETISDGLVMSCRFLMTKEYSKIFFSLTHVTLIHHHLEGLPNRGFNDSLGFL